MATDSTNLPQGETTLDAGMDMTASDLDLTTVQEAAATEPSSYVDLPKGKTVILLPVEPGQTVRLPTDTAAGLLAKIGPEGNLAIVVDGRTIILQGFLKANDESPIKIVTNDGDDVNVADLIAATDPSLDIQTAAGPAAGGQGEGAEGSGIFVPFLAGPGLGGIDAEGILDPTALRYRLIDDDYRLFTRSEEDPTPDFTITFDVLGGIVNEDDLGPDQPNQRPDEIALAKLVFKEGGNNGEGNDPFDGTDRDDNDGDGIPDESDFNDNDADPDPEPFSTVATVKVDFHGDAPGKLEVDVTKLPPAGSLTSEGRPISYQVIPADPGVHGNGIVGFVDLGGTAGVYDEGIDDLVFTVEVDKDKSTSEFKVTFTLHDNIDNKAPDENGDGSPDLLGADEQLLDLPVHFKITDSNNDSVDGTLPIAVEDDKPFFGEVVGVGENMEIVDGAPDGASVTHDETKGVQSDDGADDVSLFDFTPFPPAGDTVLDLAADLYHEVVVHAGFSLPFGDSVGALLGVAQSQVKVSFGADGASQEYSKVGGRESVFGAISGSGENERPFELFMIDQHSVNGTVPVEDNKSTLADDEGNLTASPQKTNLTVTWNGAPVPVWLVQIDANTIVGYIETGELSLQADGIGAGREAVLVIDINDAGVLSFFQLHQVNNPDPADRDEPIQILAEDGETPLIYVRASDYDGDHAIQPVTVEIQDDAPKFIKVCYDKSGGVVDEDELPAGNKDSQPGDDNGGTSTSGSILFSIGADKPGTLSIGDLKITDSSGNPIALADLKTADGNSISLLPVSAPDGFGVVTLQAVEVPGGAPVFTMTLDTSGSNMGAFTFTLNQALSHPDSNNNNADDKTDNGKGAYEDDLNFDFKVTATDVDGDKASGSIVIKVDDDVPVFESVDFGKDHDSDKGVGQVDEDWLPGGNMGLDFGPGDNSLLDGTSTDGTITFKFGADQPGVLSFGDLKITDSDGNVIDIAALKTADGNGVTLEQSGPDTDGVITLKGVEAGSDDAVFTLTLDSSGADVGAFKFTLNQALSHPFTDPDLNNDDVPQSRFEDDLKFDFTVIATDADGDSAQGSIKVVVDDDSPKALDDHDVVTEGKTGGNLNIATGNVVTGGDATLLGKDSNFTFVPFAFGDGTPDLPGADRPYTISKLAHDGDTYTLSADGQSVLKNGLPLNGTTETFDPLTGTLKIPTDEGGTFEIVMTSPNQSDVGEYRYTVPQDADHAAETLVGPQSLADSLSDDFNSVGEWTTAFGGKGVALTAIGGSLAIKSVDVQGAPNPNYRGIGVANYVGDEPEVDLGGHGGSEGLKLELLNASYPGGVTSASLLIGALFDGVQFDNGNQEILKWEIWNNGALVGSGQILGDNDGLVTLDIDTGGQKFDEIRLFPVSNGASGGNNSDFQLINVEICKPSDKFTEEFDYTLRDADGDESTATLTVGVLDTEPETEWHRDGISVAFTVDEDGLPGVGIGDHQSKDAEESQGAPNAPADDAKHLGTIPFTPGFDPVTIELSVGNGGDTGLDTVDGKNVFAAWDAATGTLVGYIQGTDPSDAANQVFKMTVTDAQTGAFSFTLLKPVEHPNTDDGYNDNTENQHDVSFLIDVQIEDKDCDVATTKIKVTIDDDMPVITHASGSIALNVDETLGGDGTDFDDPVYPGAPQDGATIENDEALVALPAALTNPVYGIVIGADTAPGSSLFSFNPGADGLQSAVYSLSITGGGATGLKDTATGLGIVLVQNGSVIEGRAVDGNGATPDPVVFAFTIDPVTGEVSMAQYRAIDHGAEEGEFGAPDEVATMLSGKLSVTLTVTDKDGDTVSASKDFSGSITFDDDGPIVGKGSGTLTLALDETVSQSDDDFDDLNFPNDGVQDGNAIEGDENFVALPPVLTALGTPIGAATGSAVGLFSVQPGSDGLASVKYFLQIGLGATGLTDTASQTAITLSYEGGVVKGKDGLGNLVFAISIDQATGEVSVAQFRAVDHGDEEAAPGAHDEVVFLGQGSLSVVAIATDKDGDSDSESVDISHAISFDDDGPAALDDFDEVTEGEGHVATGNVVTGAHPELALLGNDANGTDGNADNPGVDGPYTISKLSHGGTTYYLNDLGGGAFSVTEGAPAPAGTPIDGLTETFDGKTLKIPTAEGGTFEIVMVSPTQSEVGEYRYTGGEPPLHADETLVGPADLAATRSAAFDDAGKWTAAFTAGGITLSNLGGTGLAIKNVDVNPKNGFGGGEDYRGIGVAGGIDSAETDTRKEALQLEFAHATDNAKVLLGAFFDGAQFDSGFQEIIQWQVFDAADNLVASGQIVGSNNGLVTLDIDTGGVDFDRIVLTPLNNGAGGNSGNNSDFLLINVETCSPDDNLAEKFDYTLRDGDGDEDTATLTIGVNDTQPTIPHDGGPLTLSLDVDEDGLPAGIGNSDSPNDAPGNSASAIGNIPFTPGADPVSIELSVGDGGDTGLKTLAGQTVLAAWDSATSSLIGYIAGTDPSDAANQVFKMTVTNHQTGEVTFDLLKPIKHNDGGQDDNTENWPDPTLTVNVEIEDKDCDVAFTTVKVTIDDDMPVFKYLRADGDGVTIHDETPSLQDDDQPLAFLPSYFKGIPGAGPAIGWAEDGESGVSVGVDFGADGPASSGSIQYDLSLTSALGVDSNLDTTAGLSIWLFQEGDIVVGRVGSGPGGGTADSSGAVAFAIAIQDDGDLQVAQYLSLKHPNPADPDEDIGIALEALQAKVTATDKDGDSVSQTVNIGNLVRFDDDGPDAENDTDSVQEDVALIATGNVYTGKDGGYDGTKDANATDGNADDAGQDGLKSLVWVDGGEGGKDTNGQIAGLYGTLYVQADGDYQYKLNNDLPAVQGLSDGETLSETFQYKIVDGDDDSDPATLKITIKGKNDGVTITDLTPKAEGGDATVYEEALNAAQAGTDGSDPASTKESATGTFKITAPDGLDDVTISDGNDTITIVNNGVFVAGQKIADSDLGNTLEILSFDKTTGIVTYKYTLENDETHPDATKKDSIFDDFKVFADDVDGSSTTATLSIQVVDDLPTARADTDEVTEDTNTVTTGNVITSAGTTNNPAGKDTPGADDVAFVSKVVNFAAASITPDGDGETIAGKYGTLKMESDGDYTYTLNNSDPAVQGLGDTDSLTETFSYTLKDSDGDASTTTLTITIKGKDDPVLITDLTPSTNGGDATVYEKGLPTRGETPGSGEIADGNGNDNDDPSEVGTGSFKISAPDGVKDVTVNGTTIIDEGVLVPGPIVITTPLGNELTITGYDKTTGEITYSYLLKDNEDHPAVQGPNDLYDNMIVTLNDEDLDPTSATLSIKIVDDVPTARNDTDSVTEDAVPNTATGNVMTGAGTNEGLGGSGADTPGADGASVTKITGFGGSDTVFDGGVLEVAGQYGTLKIEADGDYTYTLNNSNPDVDALNDGGTLVDEFTYRLTDGDTDTSDATLKITINGKSDDKFPVTYDDVALVSEPSVKHFNLVLIFDVSGSMNDESGIDGLTKLQAAKQAANNMLDTYAANAGDVRVMLVWFNEFGNRQETWLDIAAAKAAINLIPASFDFALTNYETAILNAIAGFNDVDGRGDTANHEGVVYFLSDGAPTVGGNPDNSITDGTLTQWDNLLENAGNNIDKVYSVGLGTDIDGGASNPNLIDVADPDGNDNPANSVVLVDNLNDLNATLVGTVGTPVTGNILNGDNTSDGDAPLPNSPDNPGDAPAHLSYFEYDSTTNNDLDIKLTWDGAGAVVLDGLANGKSVTIAGKEVTFDTEFGKMLIDFIDGDFKFTPVEVNADKVETFSYKITDKDGDPSNTSTLKITIDDQPSQVLIEDISVKEGGTAQITVSLTDPAPAGGLKLNYTFTSGTATLGSDFAAAPGGAFITIPAGQTSVTITVNASSDAFLDWGETYNVVLSGALPAGWAFTDNTGTVHIIDNTTIAVPVTSHSVPNGGWPSNASGIGFDSTDETETGGSGGEGWDGEGGDDSLSGGDGNDHLVGDDGEDTLNGGNHNDRLVGSDDNDVLNGGNGNDLLIGGDDFDKFDGGANNDWLDVDAADFAVGRQIAGGSGNDVLDMNGIGTFTLTGNTTGVSGIEIIQLEGGGQDKLSLSASDVTDITSAGNTLFIWGSDPNDDEVTLTGGGWTQIANNQAGNDGANYNVFQNGAVKVFVDTDIDTTTS